MESLKPEMSLTNVIIIRIIIQIFDLVLLPSFFETIFVASFGRSAKFQTPDSWRTSILRVLRLASLKGLRMQNSKELRGTAMIQGVR